MTKRIEYKIGEVVGNFGFVFLRDEPIPYISSSGNQYRRAWFICPACKEECLCLIQDVRKGKKSCGCRTSELRASGGECQGKDIAGHKFGRLTPKYYKKVRTSSGKSKRLWYCECDCGGNSWTTVDCLISGHTKSCGCHMREKSKEVHTKDITDFRSGKLVAKYNTGKQDSKGNYYWYCECDCGGHKEVIATRIVGKVITSCGCEKSTGETKVKQVLEKISVSFTREWVFEDCINPKTDTKLRFDFYLPSYNTCIEYDGIQHFKEKSTWAEKEGLEDIQYRDLVKTNYCSHNNINLVRIPYTDFDKIDENYIREKIGI